MVYTGNRILKMPIDHYLYVISTHQFMDLAFSRYPFLFLFLRKAIIFPFNLAARSPSSFLTGSNRMSASFQKLSSECH